MANHVHWHIEFRSINEEATKKFEEIQKRIRKVENNQQWFGDIFVDGKEGSPTYEKSEEYDFTVENIGSKWCYIEDMGEDFINGYSAWSAPTEGIEWLIAQLSEYDEKLVSIFTYDDEMPNFFGAATYEGKEILSSEEFEYEDLIKRAVRDLGELSGKYDNKEGDWKDEESQDIFDEVMYEIMNDLQEEEISYGLQYSSKV
tara:strand:- start:500 stop:1102 length:603 start_codon:yes stop_codon:yes gene_type:complete